MIKYSLFKIKSGKREILESWFKELMGKHYQEGVESIIEEDLMQERCIIFGKGDDSYLFYEHIPVYGKEKKPFNPNREINIKHASILKECLEDKIGNEYGKIGYDFNVKDLKK